MDNLLEKSSADIQLEIDADRQRIEDRIDAIQQRMSPGQLVDEVLAYAKGSGGGEYVSNLGKALKANPLPVALIGVSLTWLMAKQGSGSMTPASDKASLQRYPLYSARGAIRRLGPPEDIDGARYSHFTDDTGQRFKALTDDAGRRAGNFVDATGQAYRGFADVTGKQITQIADEAGSLLDASSGWASETWQQLKDTASNIGQKVSDAANSASGSASTAGSTLMDQSTRLNEAILKQFRDQPLVGGALAFAVGAAIGAALPHTDQEDQALGEVSDSVKANVAATASDLVDQGTEIASDAYDKAISVASDVHDAAKDRIAEEVDRAKQNATEQ